VAVLTFPVRLISHLLLAAGTGQIKVLRCSPYTAKGANNIRPNALGIDIVHHVVELAEVSNKCPLLIGRVRIRKGNILYILDVPPKVVMFDNP
jgi:hypothetical protein